MLSALDHFDPKCVINVRYSESRSPLFATFRDYNFTSNLRAIDRLIRPYGSRHLLHQWAALQLLPDNAHVLGLLEGICGACAQHDRPGRAATMSDLDRLVREAPLTRGALVHMDDPHEHHFTERFPYHGGDHPVFPGPVMGGIQPLSLLARALNAAPEVFGPSFLAQATALISAVLTISGIIIRGAGLAVPADPRGRHWQDPGIRGPLIAVPAEDDLRRLATAVTLTPPRLRAALSGDELAALRRLVWRYGSAPPGDTAVAVQRFPLIDLGDHIIVAGPHSLLTATVQSILDLARQCGEADQLSAQLSLALHAQVQLELVRLGAEPVAANGLPDTPLPRQLLYRVDTDKLLQVITAAQDVSAAARTSRDGWIYSLPDSPLARGPDGSDVMTLVVFAELGQRFRLQGTGAWRAHPLVGLRADDLGHLATAFPRDPTVLWQYAESRAALRRDTEVHAANPIDELAALSDLGFPRHFPFGPRSSLQVSGRTGADWRRQMSRQRDSRLAPWPDDGLLVPVERPDAAPPGVYIPVIPVQPGAHVAVVRNSSVIWVMAGEDGASAASTMAHPALEMNSLVQGTAVWLAALGRHLPEGTGGPLSVLVHHAPARPTLAAVPDYAGRALHVWLGAGFYDLLAHPDNLAERHLVALLYQGLRRLSGRAPASRRVRRIVNRVAPRGNKRLFLRLQTAQNAELDPRGLMPVRYLRPAAALDWGVWTGARLAARFRWIRGDDVRVTTTHLREANGLLFGELQRRVRTFDGEALLYQLLSQYEALRHDVARLTQPLASRQLVFGAHATPVLDHADETSTALRFLIELVAAEPPQGTRPPSHLGLDELIGLAVCLIHYGFVSDALHYQLGRVTGRLDQDGALVVDAPDYREAIARLAAAAARDGAREPRQSTTDESGDLRPAWIDAMCEALYGLTVPHLIQFFNAVLDLGEQGEGGIVAMPLQRFELAVRQALDWPDTRVQQALQVLTLGPRSDFFAVPEGMARSEVYPWQYNRELSFLRRPLVLTHAGDDRQVVWGNRSLEVSKQHWLYGRLLSGRIQLPTRDSPARRAAAQLLEKLKTYHSDAFNAEVAHLARRQGLVARTQVKRFGTLRLEVDGSALGDIDVLVIDAAKRRLILVECKDYPPARTPFELGSQMDEFLRGRPRKDGSRARGLFERHIRRTDFVRAHLPEVLTALECDAAQVWSVVPVCVMSVLPNTLLASSAPMPLVDVADFSEWLLQGMPSSVV